MSKQPRESRRGFALTAALCILALGGTSLHAGIAESAPPLRGEMGNFDVVAPPQPAPDFIIRDGAGSPLTVADFAGHVVVMNFWATWCAPCVHEMPSLDRLQAALGERGLLVVAVSLDRNGTEAIVPFYERTGIAHLDVYLDEAGRVSRAFETRGLPTTIVLDEQGRIVGRYIGPAEWDSADAIALLEYFLPPES